MTSGFAASPSSAQAPLAPQLEATPDASAFVPAKPTDTPMLVHPDGPAPPLTQIFVNNVCNATTCETISSGQPSTVNTYTGASVYVYVWEIGYGNGELATQGGSTIASAYLIGKVPVCAAAGYTITCPAGSSVVGFRYEWNAGHYLSLGYGTFFAAQDTSSVSPFNTLSTGITIKYSL